VGVLDDGRQTLDGCSGHAALCSCMKISFTSFLLSLHKRKKLRLTIAGLAILFMANLDALVDLVSHPEVPYFHSEHLIVGGITALVTLVFFIILGLYVATVERALRDINTLKGLLPICSSCNRIRTSDDQWHIIEKYISERTEARFTHSLCPECFQKLYGDRFK